MRPAPDSILRVRLAAAEHALAEALELIADLNDQLTRANRASVRMARRADVAAKMGRAA